MSTCEICNKPILEGQPRNGITGNHWDCDESKKNKLIADLNSIKKPMLKQIANKHAPNRVNGISETQLKKICDEYLDHFGKFSSL